ncbi:acyl-CoA N-acyltransferase [Calycina marina]|uniref:Acyl-CoA N-acyltransferase n=1 Tax=Calycina marina TaxID=1763456 RepID=A0A9P7Z4V4_9HELO|nr:acyl-CoA N-acyltransferase [Calycina marina]
MMDPLSILALAAETVQRSEAAANKSQLVPACTTRRGQLRDIPLLGPLERSAAEIFRTVNMDSLLDLPTLSRFNLTSLIDAGHLWVAVDRYDQLMGFIGGENIGGNFHIVELSVAQRFQGNGIGKMLMARMMDDVKREGFRATTLTAFRSIPWNGPFYRKLGFMEVDLGEMGHDYMKIWQNEGSLGLDMGQRCLMGRIL